MSEADKPFTIHELRDRALFDTALSDRDFRVLCALLSHRNAKSRLCCPGHDRLASELGTSESSLRRGLKCLRRMGYVDWVKGASGRSNRYWFRKLGDKDITPNRAIADRSNMNGLDDDRPVKNEQSGEVLTGQICTPDQSNLTVLTGQICTTNSRSNSGSNSGSAPPPAGPHRVEIETGRKIEGISDHEMMEMEILNSGIEPDEADALLSATACDA